ncbi:MAG: beta-galactosidase [Clostridia bacterium]|nr:beta-galactosidase [Clostridia bacterium]
MYEVKNGILYENGKPTFALGLSYYASYHPSKYAVPPEGDRIGQLKLDIKEMREAGFNYCRFAARGIFEDRHGEGADGITAHFDLIDKCVEEADKNNIAVGVRLQGYTLNVSGYKNLQRIKADGSEFGAYEGFLPQTLCHSGILTDNRDCTEYSARHFSKYQNVVNHQMYNEPDYSVDYNPSAIEAFRKWLIDRGYATKEAAKDIYPPKKRIDGADENGYNELFFRYTMFLHERLCDFLCDMDNATKIGNPRSENYTCWVSDNGFNFPKYFRTAKSMWVIGITHYFPSQGARVYRSSMIMDVPESAAAVNGKHAWLVEYNANTKMKPDEWERETYSAIGSGLKGIAYYQWRGDYAAEGSPETNLFGLLNNDRTKTGVFDRAVEVNRLINSLSEKIVTTEKHRAGIAILVSENMQLSLDAYATVRSDLYSDGQNFAYYELRSAGYPVDFVTAEDLASNPLGVRLLILPCTEGMSDEEKGLISAFTENGGLVYSHDFTLGAYTRLNGDGTLLSVKDIVKAAKIAPTVRFDGTDRLDAKLLCGESHSIVTLCNIHTDGIYTEGGEALTVNADYLFHKQIASVSLHTPDGVTPLGFTHRGCELSITLPTIKAGGLVLIRH